jgi:hypothetical protein
MTVLQVQSLPALAHQRRQISFWRFFPFGLGMLVLNRGGGCIGLCDGRERNDILLFLHHYSI